MNEGDKLYIVTRSDLEPGYQIAQSCHALRQFAHEHPELDREWFERSNYIACLSVGSEAELDALLMKAIDRQIPHSIFREPDIDDQMTAIAFAPGEATRKLCSSCSLALKERSVSST